MLGEGGAGLPVGILVEADHSLGLGAVAEPLVREDLLRDIQAELAAVLHLSEKFLGIKCEAVHRGGEPGGGSVGREVLAGLERRHAGEYILEHARRRAGSRHELARTCDRRIADIVGHILYLFLIEHLDAAPRSGRSDDIHPWKALAEPFHLRFDSLHGGSSLRDLPDVILIEHSESIMCVIQCKTPACSCSSRECPRNRRD